MLQPVVISTKKVRIVMGPLDVMAKIPAEVLERVAQYQVRSQSPYCNGVINDILNTTVARGGKRLRPMLTLLMARLFNVTDPSLDIIAESIEWVHAASLAHDDVVDEADIRRGRPSINAVVGNKKAVLAGDYLLSHVIVRLCETGNTHLVQEMSLIIKKLAEGEWLQSDAITHRNYTPELIEQIALCKTASVMSWCAMAPVILARMDSLIEVAQKFGLNLGLAFQYQDDVLDFVGPGEKEMGIDLKNGQLNSVTYEFLKSNKGLMQAYQNNELTQAELNVQGEDFQKAISSIQQKALDHVQKAETYLDNIVSELIKTFDVPAAHIEAQLPPIKAIMAFLVYRPN